MIKAILFDADGVTIKRDELFSIRYSREYGVPIDEIVPFFKNEFEACTLGKADIRIALVPYLQEWGWKGTVDDFLTYWFECDNNPNAEVLDMVRTLRKGNYPCFLVSDQEKQRANFIAEKMGFNKLFDGLFFSCDLGVSKSEPEYFRNVLESLNIPAGDVAYFDDDVKNVEVAKSIGIQGCHYTKSLEINDFLKRFE